MTAAQAFYTFHVFARRDEGDDDLANGPVGSDLLATPQHVDMSMSSLKDPRDPNAIGSCHTEKNTFFGADELINHDESQLFVYWVY